MGDYLQRMWNCQALERENAFVSYSDRSPICERYHCPVWSSAVRKSPFVKELPPTDISVYRTISEPPTTSSLTPLFQVTTQAPSTETVQATTFPGSNHTGTSLFHTVLPYATTTAYPVTSAAVTSASVAAPSEKSVGNHSQVSLAAAIVLVLVGGMVGVK